MVVEVDEWHVVEEQSLVMRWEVRTLNVESEQHSRVLIEPSRVFFYHSKICYFLEWGSPGIHVMD
jgi:hypothetical protein